MKLLFVMPSFYPIESSTANCVWSIIEELQKNGHELNVLTYQYNNTSSFQKYKNVSIYRINESTDQYLNSIEQLAKEILCFTNKYDKAEGKEPDSFFFYKKLTKLYNENKYDYVIACEAFYITQAVYWAYLKNNKLKYIVYQTNPYFSNKFYPDKYQKLRELYEYKAYKSACSIITTDLIYEDIKSTNVLSKLLYKIKPCMLPLIKENILKEVEDDITLDTKYINCVFVGNLYKIIREPYYTVRLFQLLKRNDVRLIFITPNVMKFCSKYKKILGDRILLYDRVSFQAAFNIMNKADFLINIGNSVPNMLPGKLIDYISTGKSIINIYSIDNCPSLNITKNYENCINIKQNKNKPYDNVKQLNDFINKNRNKKMKFKEIKSEYNEYTPSYVANLFTTVMINNK